MTNNLHYRPIEEFFLDPMNPRLGRAAHRDELNQAEILARMSDWSLEELATSFLESGFWAHEAVLCVKEQVGGEERLVVVEGNRRIAALKRLKGAFDGDDPSRKWNELINDVEPSNDLFTKIPYIELEDRSKIDAFLGFRHVTGIKEWAPAEKAQFIAKMIDESALSYRDVMRQIGSKTPTVQRNYISYCILKQIEESIDEIDLEKIENKFSVLFLSLRTKNVQDFLGVREKFDVPPAEVFPPIDDDHINNVVEYSRWLFGDEETPPVVTDSRDTDKFAKVLASTEGLQYLRSVKRPSLEKAFVISGGDQEEVFELITTAAYNIEEALSSVHHYAEDEALQKVVKRLSLNVKQLDKIFDI